MLSRSLTRINSCTNSNKGFWTNTITTQRRLRLRRLRQLGWTWIWIARRVRLNKYRSQQHRLAMAMASSTGRLCSETWEGSPLQSLFHSSISHRNNKVVLPLGRTQTQTQTHKHLLEGKIIIRLVVLVAQSYSELNNSKSESLRKSRECSESVMCQEDITHHEALWRESLTYFVHF